MDPGGNGIQIFLGRTGAPICPVIVVLNYCAIHPPHPPQLPLFIQQNGSPLARDLFVREVRSALRLAGVNQDLYVGHSFRIGAATTAALAGVPAHIIKALGRWESEAYQLYTRIPWSTLAAVSSCIATHPQAPPQLSGSAQGYQPRRGDV